MKFKFWSSLFISVFFPLLVICVWGVYFIQSYESQTQEKSIKNNLKQEQIFYFKSLDAKLLFLEKKVQQVFEEQKIKDVSPLFALMVVNGSQNKITKKYFWDGEDSPFKKSLTSNQEKLVYFVKGIERLSKDSFQFDTFSFNKKDKMNVIILDGKRFPPLKKSNHLVVVLRDNYFFQVDSLFSEENSKNEKVFLVNGQGRLFFHNEVQHLFKILPKQSSIRESIQDFYYSRNKQKWFLKTSKSKNRTDITYIQKWKDKDAFLVTKTYFFQPLFVFNSWSLKWSLFCLGVFLLIFMGLIFTVSPLFSAYNYLKSFFIYFAKTGEPPSWSQNIKNPFLYFYNNRSEQIRSFQKNQEVFDRNSQSQTFQSLLQEEVKKLKFKYTGLEVVEKLESNVKVFGFESFMRTILHELLLNAVESMGAYETQNIIISSKEEDGQFIFSIKDGGVGLLEEEYNKAFQLYYSTKSQLGVGLNLVHSLVTSNDGTVEFLNSPQQKGLEVVITLPLSCFLKMTTNKKGKSFYPLKKGEKIEESSKVSL